MSFRFTARLAFVLVAVLALSTVASAEPVDSGELFVVAANSGLFDGATTYTIIHHSTYGDGDFPDFLQPIGFPAFESEIFAGLPFVMDIPTDGQAFALGFTSGPDPAHLLKTGDGPVDPGLQAAMLLLATGLVGDPIAEISAADFWALGGLAVPTAGSPSQGWLDGSVFAMSAMTSEDLFGLTDAIPAGVFGFGLVAAGSSVLDTSFPPTTFYEQGTGFRFEPFGRSEPPPLPPPFDLSTIPEPATLALVAGALGAGYLRRKKKKAA